MKFAFHNNAYDLDQALKNTYGLEALTSKRALSETEGKIEESEQKVVFELDDQKKRKVVLSDLDAKSNRDYLKHAKQDLSEESDIVVVKVATSMLFFLESIMMVGYLSTWIVDFGATDLARVQEAKRTH